jgi:hypothetical protein
MHGCVGESIGSKFEFRISEKEADIGTIDFITSKSSTLPYDDDTMRRMIQLVQAAKGTPVCSQGKGDR